MSSLIVTGPVTHAPEDWAAVKSFPALISGFTVLASTSSRFGASPLTSWFGTKRVSRRSFTSAEGSATYVPYPSARKWLPSTSAHSVL